MEVGLRVPSAEALCYVGQGLPGLVRNAQATIPIALVSWWIAYRSGWFLRATHGRGPR
jgi:hypothetical protein